MSYKVIAGSISAVAASFRTFLTSLPIGQDDRAKIDEIISVLEKASASLAVDGPTRITVKKSDVEKAVSAMLPALVEKAVAEALAAKEGEA